MTWNEGSRAVQLDADIARQKENTGRAPVAVETRQRQILDAFARLENAEDENIKVHLKLYDRLLPAMSKEKSDTSLAMVDTSDMCAMAQALYEVIYKIASNTSNVQSILDRLEI